MDDPDYEWLMIDASYIKVHPHAAGAKGGSQNPVLGLLHGRKEAVAGQKVKHAVQAGADAAQVSGYRSGCIREAPEKDRRPARIALRQLQAQTDEISVSALFGY